MSVKNSELPEKVEPGKPIEVQLSPRGQYGQIVDGKDIVQVVDDAAIENLVKNFDADVLVDSDHESEEGKGTKAEAWVKRVFADPDRGLVGVFEFTDVGADNVNNKRYRFISPAWTLGADGRPEKLVSVGMTNRPNLPVAPVLNMRAVEATNETTDANETEPGTTADAAGVTASPSANAPVKSALNADASHVAEATAEKPETAGGDQPKEIESEKGNENMDAIKEMLGLPLEATDEDVTQAISALLAKCQGMEEVQNALGLEPTASNEDVMQAVNAVINQCGELQAKNAEIEQAKLNAEADQFVSENEDIVPEEAREEIRNEYLANPEAANRCVANMRRAAERAVANAKANIERAQRVVNVHAAKMPDMVAKNSQACGFDACKGDPAKENEWIAAHGADML